MQTCQKRPNYRQKRPTPIVHQVLKLLGLGLLLPPFQDSTWSRHCADHATHAPNPRASHATPRAHVHTSHLHPKPHILSHTLSLTHTHASTHTSRAKITGLPLPHAGRASAALLSGLSLTCARWASRPAVFSARPAPVWCVRESECVRACVCALDQRLFDRRPQCLESESEENE